MSARSSYLPQFFDFCFPGVFCTPRIFVLSRPHNLCISQLFLSSFCLQLRKFQNFPVLSPAGGFALETALLRVSLLIPSPTTLISHLIYRCSSLLAFHSFFEAFFEDFTHLLHLFRVVRDPLAFIGCVSFVAAVQTSSLEYSFF